jgi:hypothetical protein
MGRFLVGRAASSRSRVVAVSDAVRSRLKEKNFLNV